MRGALAGSVLGSGLTLIAAWFWLAWSPLAHARECGIASWYSYTGHRTASGVPYTGKSMTAAHKSLPFGSRVRVTDLGTGRSIVVTIDDRGPFVRGRIIDLSPTSRQALGMGGLGRVCIEKIG